MPRSGAAALAVLAASFLLLLQRAATQGKYTIYNYGDAASYVTSSLEWFTACVVYAECPGGESAVLTDQSLEEAYGDGDCVSVQGDLVLGTANCSLQCSLTSLSALSQIRSVTG